MCQCLRQSKRFGWKRERQSIIRDHLRNKCCQIKNPFVLLESILKELCRIYRDTRPDGGRKCIAPDLVVFRNRFKGHSGKVSHKNPEILSRSY